jgi:hypothetical protein
VISYYQFFLWPPQWFQLIIANRPNYEEVVEDLTDVNDVRNGVFATENIHRVFDPREVAILKVSCANLIIFDLSHLRPRRCLDSKSCSYNHRHSAER